MKGLLFTDPHVTPKAEFSQPTEDGLTDYLHRCIESFHWIESKIKELKPAFVACCGDVTETTGYVDSTTLKIATELFSRLAHECSLVGGVLFVMPGNHDFFSTLHNIHNLESLRYIENLIVIDKPTFVSRFSMMVVPWVEDTDSVKLDPNAKFALTHMDVKDGLLYKTRKSDFGVNAEEFATVPVFNGHQHAPCLIGTHFQNIGSLLSRSFHDVDSPSRGIIVLDVEGNDVSWEHINNPYDIPFKDIIVKTSDDAAQWENKLEEGSSGYELCYVRIKYSHGFRTTAEKISYFTKGARLEQLPDTSQIVLSDTPTKSISPSNAFEEYVNISDFNHPELKELVLRNGYEYLSKVGTGRKLHSLPLHFEHIQIDWYQSIGSISIRLDQSGVHYVEGSNEDDPYDANGVGKSSIQEAIFWCLTSKSLRGLTGDDIIHWDKPWCRVSITLSVGNSRYRITRGRNHPEIGSKVLLEIESSGEYKNVSARLKSDTNELVSDLIGRSDKVLKQSVFFVAGLETRFTNLGYPARVALIEEVTDAEVYSDAYKLVKNDCAKSLLNLSHIKGQISNQEKSINDLLTKLSSIESSLLSYQETSGPELSRLESELNDVKLGISLSEASVETNKIKINQIRPKIDVFETKLKESKRETDLLNPQSAIARSALDHAKRTFSDYDKKVKLGKCIECGQLLGSESDLVKVLPELELSIKTLTFDFDEIQTKVSHSCHQYNIIDDRLGTLKNAVNSFQSEVDKNFTLLKAFREKQIQLNKSIDYHQSRLNELESNKNSINEAITDGRSSLKDLLFQSESAQLHYDTLEWLQGAFHTSGLRAHLLFQHSLPYLNSRVMKHSAKMGQPCKLDWKENKQGKLEDKIEVVFSGRRTYVAASRGERMMSDLAIQCAFNDLAIATGGSHINLIIADEVIDYLDQTSVQNFIDILSSKSIDMTIFLMGHRPFLDTMVPHKISLVKQGGVTSIRSIR